MSGSRYGNGVERRGSESDAPGRSSPGGPAAGPGGPVDAQAMRDFLVQSRLIADVATAAHVAQRLEAAEYPAQATIVRAGAPAEWLGILYRGKASLVSVHAGTGAKQVLESLRPGDLLGEIAPLLGTAHPQMVVADEPCVVLKIATELIDAMLQRVPSFSAALARRLAMRVVKLGVMALRQGPSGEAVGDGARPAPATGSAAAVEAARPGGVIPYVEIAEYDPTPKVASLVPEKLIRQHRLLPLRLQGSRLTVGMVTPRNAVALSELRRVLQRFELEVVAISLDDYVDWVGRLRLATVAPSEFQKGGPGIKPESLTFDATDSEREADKALRVIGDEVIRAVNRIVAAALEREASDVHIEPDPTGVKVRFRVQGALVDWNEYLPTSFAKPIAARLKILAGLDITERRLPQDGRIGLTVGKRDVDMRLSTLPSARGEKLVLRVFEAASVMRPLEKLFAEPTLLSAVRDLLGRSTGAILVAGGTGSGKSTTLYSMLNERRKVMPDQNTLMVEDPIEYRLQGVTQVQINPGIGLGFAQVLRAMLRQDPDVIVLGETRDADTARLALEAAMTGHLVLTSLHAGDAISTLQRLETLDCPRELIAQSVSIVIVQRLVRRLCPACTRLEPPTPVLQESLASRKIIEAEAHVNLPRAAGCEQCGQTGFQGRIAVLESLQCNPDVRNAILLGQPLPEVARIATETKAYFPFHRYAAYLMARSLISAADALMAVAG